MRIWVFRHTLYTMGKRFPEYRGPRRFPDAREKNHRLWTSQISLPDWWTYPSLYFTKDLAFFIFFGNLLIGLSSLAYLRFPGIQTNDHDVFWRLSNTFRDIPGARPEILRHFLRQSLLILLLHPSWNSRNYLNFDTRYLRAQGELEARTTSIQKGLT